MQIWLLRHGKTQYNAEKRYQGVSDIPLSKDGRNELVRAEIQLKTVYITPLVRTRQTAEILFPDAELVVSDGLREMDFGDFEGRSYIEMEDDAAYRAWVDGGCRGQCPNGESMSELSERTCRAFEMLMLEAIEKGSDLAIVAHGGTQMAIMERYAEPKKSFYEWMSPNAGGFVLEADADMLQSDRRLMYKRTVQYTKGGAR